MTNEITPQQLSELTKLNSHILLIDVRSPAEFGALHVEQAINLPLDRVTPEALRALGAASDRAIAFICQSGMRGRTACDVARRSGFAQAVNVYGGTLACQRAGFPVVRGKAAISLERQVRIAAGSLVLIGFVLGYFVHPYAFGLCAFVGAGLVFAGVTDTCGMAFALARMPWNQRSNQPV